MTEKAKVGEAEGSDFPGSDGAFYVRITSSISREKTAFVCRCCQSPARSRAHADFRGRSVYILWSRDRGPELTPDIRRQRKLDASASRWPRDSGPAGHKRDSGNWAEWEWVGLNECTAEVGAGTAL